MAKKDRRVKYRYYDFDAEDAIDKSDMAKRFLTACDQNNVPLIKQCLINGVDPNSQHQQQTALHRTCKNGYVGATQVLLNNCQLKINSKNDFGSTALIIAADRNRIDICRQLVRAGADVQLADKFGSTALHRAVHWCNSIIIELLLTFKANPNAQNIFLKTPLHIAAAESTCIETVALLIKYGAEINMNKERILPVLLECGLCCSTRKQLDIIEFLLDNGANVNIKAFRTDRTVLHIVALTGYVPLAVLLIKRGANIQIRDRHNLRAIDIARKNQNQSIIDLLSGRAPIEDFDERKETD